MRVNSFSYGLWLWVWVHVHDLSVLKVTCIRGTSFLGVKRRMTIGLRVATKILVIAVKINERRGG